MLETLRFQQNVLNVRVLGEHHLPDKTLAIGFGELVKSLYSRDRRLPPVVFHARRNNEMIQAVLLKRLYPTKIRALFTSTAQRHHSRFTRWLMKQMDGVISTCEAAASYLKVPPDRLVPHGIDSAKYRPIADKNERMIALGLPGQQLIGIFGRVREQKGIHLFVQSAIQLLPRFENTTAVIVGAIQTSDEPFVQALKADIDAAGLAQRILFTGELPAEAVPRYIQACDVVCALSYNEGFGLTVLEAMSTGAAVVASRAGAWPDIIRPSVDGYLVDVGNQEQVNDALNRLLSEPSHATKLGNNGRDRVKQHFTIEREAAMLCEYYRYLRSI